MNLHAAAAMESPLEIARDHPSFAGHFPKFPVLPGAVLLDEALLAIEHARSIDLKEWRIASVKFVGVVRPGDALRLEHAVPKIGTIRFSIRTANGLVASGSLSSSRLPAGA
jgi:3-hydroxyacyl-[acyl-carrier-protein] dehydratase